MQKFFKYVPAVVLCYLIAMFLCTLGVWDMAETKPITFQSLILLLGSAFLVSAIATNVGNKLYALTNFSDKATWTVLFVTASGWPSWAMWSARRWRSSARTSWSLWPENPDAAASPRRAMTASTVQVNAVSPAQLP